MPNFWCGHFCEGRHGGFNAPNTHCCVCAESNSICSYCKPRHEHKQQQRAIGENLANIVFRQDCQTRAVEARRATNQRLVQGMRDSVNNMPDSSDAIRRGTYKSGTDNVADAIIKHQGKTTNPTLKRYATDQAKVYNDMVRELRREEGKVNAMLKELYGDQHQHTRHLLAPGRELKKIMLPSEVLRIQKMLKDCEKNYETSTPGTKLMNLSYDGAIERGFYEWFANGCSGDLAVTIRGKSELAGTTLSDSELRTAVENRIQAAEATGSIRANSVKLYLACLAKEVGITKYNNNDDDDNNSIFAFSYSPPSDTPSYTPSYSYSSSSPPANSSSYTSTQQGSSDRNELPPCPGCGRTGGYCDISCRGRSSFGPANSSSYTSTQQGSSRRNQCSPCPGCGSTDERYCKISCRGRSSFQ